MHTTNSKPLALQWLVVVSSWLLISCGNANSRATNEPEKYQVINPLLLDTVYNNEFVADIQSVQNVELRARVKGFIEKIHADEGKPIKAGQVLFTLSSRVFKEELLKANAQLKSAVAELKAVEVEIKNTRLLTDKNIVSKSGLEMLQAKKDAIAARIDEATASIGLAKLNVSFTEVRAPFSGVINRIPLKAGSLVEEGSLLTTLSNNKEVFAYFNVSEKEYLSFIKNNETGKRQVSLLLADNQLFDQKGVVETAENEVDKSTGNIAFRARFANPNQLLKHGSSGKILLEEKLDKALVVPQKSTFEIQDKMYVYVLDKDSRVRMKSFVPGLRLQHLFVVEKGLSVNDKIIYEGIQQVKEGDKISPQSATLSQLLFSTVK